MHGVSLAAKRLHSLDNEFDAIVNNITESIYCPEAADFFTTSLECSLKEALHSLRKTHETVSDKTINASEFSSAIKCVENLTGRLYHLMYACVRNTSTLNVICHGDLWINNLMFRYNNRNECDGVKFIDLQTLRYTSPVIDILHFLYTSTERAVRELYMDRMIDVYVESLYATMQRFDVHDEYVQNIDELNAMIRSELRDKALYGLGICMWLLPAVTFSPDNIIDLDTITIDDFQSDNQEKTMTQMQTPEYHMRMRDTVVEFYRKGIINDIT